MIKHANFRWVWLSVVLVVLLLGLKFFQSTAIPSVAAASPPLLAFYYGWYDDQTWTSGLSPETPLQTYRSTDSAAVARHVSQAKGAGIEALVMSWYGPQIAFNQTEPNFIMLLDEARRQGLTAAVDFETHSPFFPDRASVVEGLKYLLDTHSKHPAYFKFNGKPVIFFWQQNRFSVEEWESIRQEVDPNHTSLWIAEGTNLSYQFHFDGHHLYNIAWANDVATELNRWQTLVRWFGSFYDVERYWVATTMPGFDERHLDRPDNNYRPRGTGEFYKESWVAAMATEPDMLIITSFNEWIEDSQIEPSVSYGDYYLNLTRALRFGEPHPATPVLPTPTPTITPRPTSTPGLGSIVGIITDADTGARLAGATVSVEGQTTQTDADGFYRFDNVTDGLQVVTVTFFGYFTTEKSRIVVNGETVWNSIAMPPGVDSTATPTPTATPTSTSTTTPSPTATSLPPTNTPPPGTGTLFGVITNAETGDPIEGAVVSAAEQMVLTNNSGVYILTGLLPGEQFVSAQHADFEPASKIGIVIAGITRWNSFSMIPLPSPTPLPTPPPAATNTPPPTSNPTATYTPPPTHTSTPLPTATSTPLPTATPTNTAAPVATATLEPGSLVGLITNAQTGEKLVGATVSANGQVVQTNSSGVYLFAQLPPGKHEVTAEYPGFHPASKTGFVVSTQTWWNSIALTPLEIATPTVQPSPTSLPTATPPPPAPTATPFPTATSPPPTPVPTQSAQTGSLIGVVTNAQTGERLAGVTVSVAGQSMVTAETGVYTFENVPEGGQIVTAEKDGYQLEQKSRTVIPGQVRWNSIKLTPLEAGCPTTSSAEFALIPVIPVPGTPRPDYLHGDLNLAQRGYSSTTAGLRLIDYSGGTDPNAPQLAGLFEPSSFPGIRAVYRVNHWDWGCGEHGCRGGVITDWPTTLAGLASTPGQAIYIPERPPQIYSGGYKALVLYAEEQRITLGYTRDDTVATGYVVHIENVCVDPNLLALYRAQNDAGGFRATAFLPTLRENERLGTALDSEIQVAVRDRGAFMDPRSRKDWWQEY